MSSKQTISIDVQPTTEVYGLFRHFTYTEGQALAEFIDNSTASYFAHENELKQKTGQEELSIIVNYDSITDTISIEDDAYGMELDNFKRAVLLGKNINAPGNRNEFGYGLKTAATWFGDLWVVESTEYGSHNKYKIEMDINSLVVDKNPVRPIEKTEAEVNEHYTIITISRLNKKLSTKKVKNQIVEILGSMYRRDLLSGRVKIKFNGITLSFKEYPILYFRNQFWKKQLDFSVHHNNKNYRIKGFVGIMTPGGFDKAGFALFRNDRVIIGGYGKTYKPKEIFAQAQSQISLKLFGELDMDDFSVTQAKNDFDWDSELESLFIQTLKENIPEFLDVAKMSIKEIKNENLENEDTIRKDTEQSYKDAYTSIDQSKDGHSCLHNDPTENSELIGVNLTTEIAIDGNIETRSTDETSFEINKFEDFTINNSDSIYTIHFITGTKLYDFNEEKKKLYIGRDHELMKGLNRESAVKIAEVILAVAYAENEALNHVDEDGKVSPTYQGRIFDSFLKGIK